MRRDWLIGICATIALLMAGFVLTRKSEAEPAPAKGIAQQADVKTVGNWQPPTGLKQVPIWSGTAPDMDGVVQAAENVLTAQTPEAIGGTTSQAVFEVTAPTMTVFPPKGRNTGAAMVVFPGGGFKALAVTIEGTEICNWMTSKGITCVLSKYRVPNSNHHYDAACDCGVTPKVLRALQDAQRTIRVVRSRAKELSVNPEKIGVIGFSAGGYLVAQTSNIFEPAYKSVDAIDKISSRPNFAIAFFPGHLCRPGYRLDPGIHVTQKTPPTFLLQAWDDPVDPICNSTLYARALNDAGVSSEVHLFAKGGHAFGLRRKQSPDRVWPSLVENWLKDIEVLER
jgi:acetyl esterase/lipase